MVRAGDLAALTAAATAAAADDKTDCDTFSEEADDGVMVMFGFEFVSGMG